MIKEESIFWGVWKNKLLVKNIYQNLLTDRVDFKDESKYYVGNRIAYKNIRSVYWLAKRKLWSILKFLLGVQSHNPSIAKLKVNDKAIKAIIQHCTDTTLLKLLHKEYSNSYDQWVEHPCLIGAKTALQVYAKELKLPATPCAISYALQFGDLELVDYLVSIRKDIVLDPKFAVYSAGKSSNRDDVFRYLFTKLGFNLKKNPWHIGTPKLNESQFPSDRVLCRELESMGYIEHYNHRMTWDKLFDLSRDEFRKIYIFPLHHVTENLKPCYEGIVSYINRFSNPIFGTPSQQFLAFTEYPAVGDILAYPEKDVQDSSGKGLLEKIMQSSWKAFSQTLKFLDFLKSSNTSYVKLKFDPKWITEEGAKFEDIKDHFLKLVQICNNTDFVPQLISSFIPEISKLDVEEINKLFNGHWIKEVYLIRLLKSMAIGVSKITNHATNNLFSNVPLSTSSNLKYNPLLDGQQLEIKSTQFMPEYVQELGRVYDPMSDDFTVFVAKMIEKVLVEANYNHQDPVYHKTLSNINSIDIGHLSKSLPQETVIDIVTRVGLLKCHISADSLRIHSEAFKVILTKHIESNPNFSLQWVLAMLEAGGDYFQLDWIENVINKYHDISHRSPTKKSETDILNAVEWMMKTRDQEHTVASMKLLYKHRADLFNDVTPITSPPKEDSHYIFYFVNLAKNWNSTQSDYGLFGNSNRSKNLNSPRLNAIQQSNVAQLLRYGETKIVNDLLIKGVSNSDIDNATRLALIKYSHFDLLKLLKARGFKIHPDNFNYSFPNKLVKKSCLEFLKAMNGDNYSYGGFTFSQLHLRVANNKGDLETVSMLVDALASKLFLSSSAKKSKVITKNSYKNRSNSNKHRYDTDVRELYSTAIQLGHMDLVKMYLEKYPRVTPLPNMPLTIESLTNGKSSSIEYLYSIRQLERVDNIVNRPAYYKYNELVNGKPESKPKKSTPKKRGNQEMEEDDEEEDDEDEEMKDVSDESEEEEEPKKRATKKQKKDKPAPKKPTKKPAPKKAPAKKAPSKRKVESEEEESEEEEVPPPKKPTKKAAPKKAPAKKAAAKKPVESSESESEEEEVPQPKKRAAKKPAAKKAAKKSK